jgi:hypothetical protein
MNAAVARFRTTLFLGPGFRRDDEGGAR